MHQSGVSLKGYLAYLCNVGLQNFMGSQSKNATIFLLQPLIFQGWQQISEVGAGGQQMFWSIFETKNDKFENIFSSFIKGTPDRCMGTD